MKKFLIVIVNIAIMATILTFVVLYAGYESRDSYRRQIENFENTTVTMEHVTENYLEGEQRICDVWAQYISNSNMTMEEAAEYIRSSHVLESPEVIGLTDDAVIQMRQSVYLVGKGEMTIDEAVAAYGTLRSNGILYRF